MSKTIAEGEFLLEKFPGKGGWTYIALPGLTNQKNSPFGCLKVKGHIETYPIQKYHLMPMGNGHLFLPVKAEIRKKINKSAGDYAWIYLEKDEDPLVIPQEFEECLNDDLKAKEFFNNLKDIEKEKYIKWIYSVKSEEARVERIVEVLRKLNERSIPK